MVWNRTLEVCRCAFVHDTVRGHHKSLRVKVGVAPWNRTHSRVFLCFPALCDLSQGKLTLLARVLRSDSSLPVYSNRRCVMIMPVSKRRQRENQSRRRLTRRRWLLEKLEDRRLLALDAFDILEPTGTIDDSTPSITWEVSSEAVQYDVVISANADLSSPVRTFDDVVTTSVTLATPLDDGTYYIGVTAERTNTAPVIDAGADVTIDEGSWFIGLGSFDDPDNTRDAENNGLSFEVAAAVPGPFDITGPASPVIIETPTVTWEASAGAINYDLVISANSDLSSPLQTFDDVSGTSQLLGTLANGTYYVGITAENNLGNTTVADNNGFSFDVSVSYPAPFSITGPISPVTTETPTVTWEASANATGYDLIVATDMDGQNAVQSYNGLDVSLTSQLLDPLADGTYFVLVTAFDDFGHETDASNNGLAFSVFATPPGPFDITGPTSPVTDTQTPLLTWEASAGATQYDVIISTTSDGSSPVVTYDDVIGTSQLLGPLANGTYYALVTAENVFDNSTDATNNGFSFEIAYVPPKEHTIFITGDQTYIDRNETYPPNFRLMGWLPGSRLHCTLSGF